VRKLLSGFILCAAAVCATGCASTGGSPAAAEAAGNAAVATPTANGAPASPAAATPSGPAAIPAAVAATGPAPTKPSVPGKASSPHATSPAAPTVHTVPTTKAAPPGTAPTSFGYSPTANAQAQIDAARAAAKADGREVLLDFGASWCGNCVAMDQDFKSPQGQAALAASYHLVQVDVDVAANMRILSGYDSSGNFGLPVLIILSPSGSMRVDTNKAGNPGFDQSSFVGFLKKWAA
jgi:thiol-disulfide isomerase/thioredoxin